MKTRPENIERLLNGYIDGELTVRRQTEVKRLLKNDPRIAERLRQLQKCKMLISSIPGAEAPPEMAEDVKARLARRSLLGEEAAALNERAGIRDLFLRKVFAAAAMIALVAIFGTVIYSIIAPPTIPHQPPIAVPRRITKAVEAPATMLAKFNGRLELTTPAFIEMDASINRAIAENGFVECISRERLGERTTYVLTCGRKGLSRLLGRLDKNWARLSSATLFVETRVFARPVAVDAVTTDQIIEITTQTTSQNALRVARDLALVNNVTEQIRNSALLTAEKTPDLTPWPRPRLTMPLPKEKIEQTAADKTKVELVIVLTRAN